MGMKSIAALRLCLDTLKRNHIRDMRWAAYAGSDIARLTESTIAELEQRIDEFEAAERPTVVVEVASYDDAE
jgi:hypothetical protein